jgi:outer membrane protein assembly factor BamE
MPEFSQVSRLWLLAGAVAATLSLGACSSFSERSRGVLSAITPYKVEVVQGNFVSKEQVEQLKAGMSRQQVREILGTPLLTDVFHTNRWDYVFTIRRQGVEPQQRRLTVFFNGEVLDRFEGDAMPSEQEFVAAVDARGRAGKVPVLEATEDQLKKFEPSKDKDKAADADTSSASLPPLPPSYPPLEAAR